MGKKLEGWIRNHENRLVDPQTRASFNDPLGPLPQDILAGVPENGSRSECPSNSSDFFVGGISIRMGFKQSCNMRNSVSRRLATSATLETAVAFPQDQPMRSRRTIGHV